VAIVGYDHAKPIIDVQVSAARLEPFDPCLSPLTSLSPPMKMVAANR
jgi:hypothetical protein